MKKFQRITCFALVAVLIVSLVAMLSGCAKLNTRNVSENPTAQLVKSIAATKEALKAGFKNSPLTFVAEALKKGTITLEQEDELTGKSTFRLHTDAEKKAYALLMQNELGEEKQEYAFYMNGTELCFNIPDMPGEKPYSVNLKTLSDDLKTSNIWNNVDMTYDEFMKEYGESIKELEKMSEDVKTTQTYGDLKQMLDKLDTIIKESTVTVTEGSVLTTSDMVKCININYSMNADRLQMVVDEVGVWAKLYYAEAMAASGALEGVEMPEGMTEADFNKELDEALKEAKKMIKDTNAKAQITVSLNPETETIVKVECHLSTKTSDNKEEYVNISLDFGKDPATSQAYQIRIANSNGTNPEAVTKLIYERMDGNNTYGRDIRLEEQNMYGDETSTRFSFNWNKADNTYTIETYVDREKTATSGEFKIANNKLEMTLSAKDAPSVKIIVERGTEVPAMPERANIMKLSDLEYLELVKYFEAMQPEDNWEEDDEYEEELPMISAMITDAQGSVTLFSASTEEDNALDALKENGIIEVNEKGEITKVNGTAVDKGCYWAVYLGEEEIIVSELADLAPDVEGLAFVEIPRTQGET